MILQKLCFKESVYQSMHYAVSIRLYIIELSYLKSTINFLSIVSLTNGADKMISTIILFQLILLQKLGFHLQLIDEFDKPRFVWMELNTKRKSENWNIGAIQKMIFIWFNLLFMLNFIWNHLLFMAFHSQSTHKLPGSLTNVRNVVLKALHNMQLEWK